MENTHLRDSLDILKYLYPYLGTVEKYPNQFLDTCSEMTKYLYPYQDILKVSVSTSGHIKISMAKRGYIYVLES